MQIKILNMTPMNSHIKKKVDVITLSSMIYKLKWKQIVWEISCLAIAIAKIFDVATSTELWGWLQKYQSINTETWALEVLLANPCYNKKLLSWLHCKLMTNKVFTLKVRYCTHIC